jgi:hypothetical protein
LGIYCYVFDDDVLYHVQQWFKTDRTSNNVVELINTTHASFFFFFAVLGFELRAYTLSHSTSPFFVLDIFKIGSCGIICLGWLQTSILLIAAS